jgi:hypothetical protein
VLELLDAAGEVQAMEARFAAGVELALGAAQQFESAAFQLSVAGGTAGGTLCGESIDGLFDAVRDAFFVPRRVEDEACAER